MSDELVRESDEQKPLSIRIQECLAIQSDDPFVNKLQVCLEELSRASKRANGKQTTKSQWDTW
jgi:hypothetical protein